MLRKPAAHFLFYGRCLIHLMVTLTQMLQKTFSLGCGCCGVENNATTVQLEPLINLPHPDDPSQPIPHPAHSACPLILLSFHQSFESTFTASLSSHPSSSSRFAAAFDPTHPSIGPPTSLTDLKV